MNWHLRGAVFALLGPFLLAEGLVVMTTVHTAITRGLSNKLVAQAWDMVAQYASLSLLPYFLIAAIPAFVAGGLYRPRQGVPRLLGVALLLSLVPAGIGYLVFTPQWLGAVLVWGLGVAVAKLCALVADRIATFSAPATA